MLHLHMRKMNTNQSIDDCIKLILEEYNTQFIKDPISIERIINLDTWIDTTYIVCNSKGWKFRPITIKHIDSVREGEDEFDVFYGHAHPNIALTITRDMELYNLVNYMLKQTKTKEKLKEDRKREKYKSYLLKQLDGRSDLLSRILRFFKL